MWHTFIPWNQYTQKSNSVESSDYTDPHQVSFKKVIFVVIEIQYKKHIFICKINKCDLNVKKEKIAIIGHFNRRLEKIFWIEGFWHKLCGRWEKVWRCLW